MTAARAVFWATIVAWGLVEARHSRVFSTTDRSKDRGTCGWSLAAVYGALAAALLLDALTPAVVSESAQTPFLIAGAGMVIAGMGFRFWAIRALGRFFTYQVTTAPDLQVVTSGPYRWLAHPSYTGLLISCLGAGIASANVASLLTLLVVPTYGLTRRIRVEEAALVDALGDSYREFLATRKRVVPGVW